MTAETFDNTTLVMRATAGAYANPPGVRAAAVRAVLGIAPDAESARVVLEALGLDPAEGRQP